MDIDLNAETKLKAQNEYEKLREALSLQNVFEAQTQIQSNFKMKIQLDSSQLVLPIFDPGLENQKSQLSELAEAWVFNTGNLVITNENQATAVKNKQQSEEGYSPFHL